MSEGAERIRRDGQRFRDYGAGAPDSVREFYRRNHAGQTLDFVRRKRREYGALERCEMGVWEALERLDALVDDSDPDTGLSQLEHALQTAEALRRDGHPPWLVLTGLIHDLGKVLCLHGEPQWAVVGDTFPVGCGFRESIVYPELFAANPDARVPEFATRHGIYEPGCGLDRVHLSWGHDEYLYLVARDHLPEEALYVIRYHSFYAAHRHGDYADLMDARDRELLRWVRAFSLYDLYSKDDAPPDVDALRPGYQELVARYFPPKIRW